MSKDIGDERNVVEQNGIHYTKCQMAMDTKETKNQSSILLGIGRENDNPQLWMV